VTGKAYSWGISRGSEFGWRDEAIVAPLIEAVAGIMLPEQAIVLRLAVEKRRNVLVVGGTSTGKTTLVNALLAEVAKTSDRVILI
jgi:Flp pilus assembly CpaF family ATPase